MFKKLALLSSALFMAAEATQNNSLLSKLSGNLVFIPLTYAVATDALGVKDTDILGALTIKNGEVELVEATTEYTKVTGGKTFSAKDKGLTYLTHKYIGGAEGAFSFVNWGMIDLRLVGGLAFVASPTKLLDSKDTSLIGATNLSDSVASFGLYSNKKATGTSISPSTFGFYVGLGLGINLSYITLGVSVGYKLSGYSKYSAAKKVAEGDTSFKRDNGLTKESNFVTDNMFIGIDLKAWTAHNQAAFAKSMGNVGAGAALFVIDTVLASIVHSGFTYLATNKTAPDSYVRLLSRFECGYFTA